MVLIFQVIIYYRVLNTKIQADQLLDSIDQNSLTGVKFLILDFSELLLFFVGSCQFIAYNVLIFIKDSLQRSTLRF